MVPSHPTLRALASRRLAAFAIDWCLFAVYAIGLFATVWALQHGKPAWEPVSWPSEPWPSQALGALFTTIPFAAATAVAESSRWKATPGKWALDLEVVRAGTGGDRPRRWQAAARAALRFVPWELGHTVGHQLMAASRSASDPPCWVAVIGMASTVGVVVYLTSLFVGNGRTPYDRVSGTCVIRKATASS